MSGSPPNRPGGAPAAGPVDPLGTDKRPAKIAGMFDAIAHRYDLLNHALSGGLDLYWRARAIRALGFTGHETVLDLCTGTCDLAIAALDRRQGQARRAVGLDFSGAMLRVGQRKLRDRRLDGQAPLVRADAMHLPFAAGVVDAVTIAFGIRNVADPAVACREIARVLRPGGRLAVLEFSMPRVPFVRGAYTWYFRNVLPRIGRVVSRHDEAYTYLPASVGAFLTPDEFAALVGGAGFTSVRAVPLTLGVVYLYTAVKAGYGGSPGNPV
jgi:demethylmenaquinone methyltransferase/2-methoxy-6-polyprenyl-1,4-benzoquinol methylase